jgi:hypothetical protein
MPGKARKNSSGVLICLLGRESVRPSAFDRSGRSLLIQRAAELFEEPKAYQARSQVGYTFMKKSIKKSFSDTVFKYPHRHHPRALSRVLVP